MNCKHNAEWELFAGQEWCEVIKCKSCDKKGKELVNDILKQIDRLREVLKLYADKNNYEDWVDCVITKDGRGKRAREGLK